jgi:hypothetical protein
MRPKRMNSWNKLDLPLVPDDSTAKAVGKRRILSMMYRCFGPLFGDGPRYSIVSGTTGAG